MSTAFSDLGAGLELEPFAVTISAAANDRYWDGAGVDHPLRAAGALYPLIAANLTILAFGRLCAEAMIQTRQQLVCHRRADAPATLLTAGRIGERYERRGRSYVVVEATVSLAGDGDDPDARLWSSTVVFTPAATVGSPR